MSVNGEFIVFNRFYFDAREFPANIAACPLATLDGANLKQLLGEAVSMPISDVEQHVCRELRCRGVQGDGREARHPRASAGERSRGRPRQSRSILLLHTAERPAARCVGIALTRRAAGCVAATAQPARAAGPARAHRASQWVTDTASAVSSRPGGVVHDAREVLRRRNLRVRQVCGKQSDPSDGSSRPSCQSILCRQAVAAHPGGEWLNGCPFAAASG